MRPSLQYLIDRFHYFNHLVFHDELPQPAMRLTTDIYRRGCTISSSREKPNGAGATATWTIKISVRFDNPADYYDDVLVHEMIHYHLGFNNLKDDCSHGRLFRKMMEDINSRFGMHIQVTGAFSDQDLYQLQPRQRYFCVVESDNGELWFQVIAKNKVAEVWDFFEQQPRIRRISWYTSVNPILSKFSLASGPSLHAIDEETLDQVLKGAISLRR